MKQAILFLFCLTLFLSVIKAETSYKYTLPDTPWNESLGNHRAVLYVEKTADIVSLDFEWRRPDRQVDEHLFLIIDAETGDTIPNIRRIRVDNEVCNIAFGPVKKSGFYYFYYLPYQVQDGYGAFVNQYYPKEKQPESRWLNTNTQSTEEAKIIEVQSRTLFDSFFPMEVAATERECVAYKKQYNSRILLFPEGRENPIRMKYKLPSKWKNTNQGATFEGFASPNEYFTFQIGVWAPYEKLENIRISISDLKSPHATIPSKNITCFNTGGIDPFGNAFTKQVDVEKDAVEALWFGVDLEKNQQQGAYIGQIVISDQSGKSQTVPIKISVSGVPLADRGDSEPWRHSRLRWLNSTLGLSDVPTKPYTKVTLKGNEIGVLGRTIEQNILTGLPKQIKVSNREILSKPISFLIHTEGKIKRITPELVDTKQTDGSVMMLFSGEDGDLRIEVTSITEFDGWSNYRYKVIPKRTIDVTDIRLELSMRSDIAEYFMGAGLPGQNTPIHFEGKWDRKDRLINDRAISIPDSSQDNWFWPFDSFWLGNAHGGLHCELKGEGYSGPLLSVYRPEYPNSWHNNGKGGFSLRKKKNDVSMIIYSGERTLFDNNPVEFEFSLITTPVKPINYKSQFIDRYYHNGAYPTPTEEDFKAGVKVINVHHGNSINPFINYPFLTVDKMKKFTSYNHSKGSKVKLYYTVRELTSAVNEIWALRSLGEEIIRSQPSGSLEAMGGYPWLREHFVTDYIPQWYQHFDETIESGISADAAVLTAVGDSRWYNYYIEGLAWLVKQIDIDGIYLDDVAFDRRILKRMRRAMDNVKENCLIDLHSNTGFSRGPITQYMEFFPYVDKIWFGESFMYNQMSPTNWLVEVSGIPFGLMGDMLHAGGNRWLGMQYGMTVRHPWMTEGVVIDPRPVWKVWDDFKIEESDMIGFWEDKLPIQSSNANIKVTSYVKKDSVLISIGNYSDEIQELQLDINWKQLGFRETETYLVMPEIEDFQPYRKLNAREVIRIEKRKGYLIYLCKQ